MKLVTTALVAVPLASAAQLQQTAPPTAILDSGWLSDAPQQPQWSDARLSDDVPLPDAAVVVAAPGGDREVAPASGDPYFLAFAAGRHYPAADERIDPALSATLGQSFTDGRPRAESYAFVMFQKRITEERKLVWRPWARACSSSTRTTR